MARLGLVDRFKWTVKFWRQGYPRLAEQIKASPLLWPAWRLGQAQWQLVDLNSYVEEGFNANALIYSAIMYKARAMTTAPLRAYSGGDPDHPEVLPQDHELSKLLSRPNTYQSQQEFQQLNTVYLNVAGNVYIYMERMPNDPWPRRMISLRPDRVKIIPMKKGSESQIGFVYVPEGKSVRQGMPILPQYMMHVKLPNPWDPLEGMGYGLSPISPMARSADVDNMATEFLQLFFQKGAMPLGFLSFKQPQTEPDLAYAQEQWDSIYGGYKNWTDVMALGSDADYKRITPTFEEMAFQNIDERNESRILGPFGVPPILIGSRMGLERSTYSNYAEARRHFWEDTLLPETRLFEVEFQYYLQGEGNDFVMYDFSDVPAMKRDVAAMADAYQKLVQSLVPPNQAAEIVGLPISDIPGGDTAYMPFSLMPVGAERPQLPQGGGASAEEDQRQEQGKMLWTKERKDLLVKQIDRIAVSWESRFGDLAVQVFEKERRKLLALLNEAKTKAQEAKATVDWEAVYKAWMEYLDEAGEEWRQAFIPLLKGVITDQSKHLSLAYGITFDVENLFATASWSEYTLTFAQPIMDTTKDAIAELLRLAMHEGWSIPQMSKALEQLFGKWMDNEDLPPEFTEWFEKRTPRYRREAIARTETMRASNFGNYETQRAWGVPKSQWWSALDERVRDTHRAAHGQIVDVGTPFKVGGYSLRYPHDSGLGAPPEEVINCRCTTLPWKPEWGEFEAAQAVQPEGAT